MTSTLSTGSSQSDVVTLETPAQETGAPPGRTHRTAARLGAVAVPLGAALALASTFFDPKSVEPEPRGMFVAYGADRAGADVAATILHYGFWIFGVGLLVAALAMATRRGRAVALTGGIVAAIGYVNMSGAVLSDWYDAYLASTFGPDRAMELSQAASDMPALSMGWMTPGFLGSLLGPILVIVGLAWGRTISWWMLAFPVLGAVVSVVGGMLIGAAAFQVLLGVLVVFGVVLGTQLLRRAEPSAA